MVNCNSSIRSGSFLAFCVLTFAFAFLSSPVDVVAQEAGQASEPKSSSTKHETAANDINAVDSPQPDDSSEKEDVGRQKKRMTAAERIKAATKKIGQEKTYHLKYKMAVGDEFRWSHEHKIESTNRMAGVSIDTLSRDQSEFVWQVKSVDDLGRITFDITLDSVIMWSKNGTDKPKTYNSMKDAKAPELYVSTAEKIGKPLSQWMVTQNGQVAESKSNYRKSDIGGIGDTPVFAFPDKAIKVGHEWDVEDSLRAKNEFGVHQNLKVQVRHKLLKVVNNKAYISFVTQILTPLESERVKSQIVTHLTKGYIVFDMERGMPIRREIEWDERVQGYKGPESFLKYTARKSERLLSGRTEKANSLPKTHAILKPIPKKPIPKKPKGQVESTKTPVDDDKADNATDGKQDEK